MRFLISQAIRETNIIFNVLKSNKYLRGRIGRLHYKYLQNLEDIKYLQSFSGGDADIQRLHEKQIDCLDIKEFLYDYVKMHTDLNNPENILAEYQQCEIEDREDAYEVARERGDFDI